MTLNGEIYIVLDPNESHQTHMIGLIHINSYDMINLYDLDQ